MQIALIHKLTFLGKVHICIFYNCSLNLLFKLSGAKLHLLLFIYLFCDLDYFSIPVKSEYLHRGLKSFGANCMMYDVTFRKKIPKAALES